MLIYNTLSGKKEEFQKPAGRPVKIFVCGPTVYDFPHIGNGRTFVAFDAFVKYLRSKNWEVYYLQNITDVDDKIIKRAREEGVPWKDVARKFERIYHENEKKLGIDSVTRYERATDHIKEIVTQTAALLDKGIAYVVADDGIYFDVSKFPDYGKLSKRTYLDAEDSVSRIDDSVNKRHRGDFVLWKFSKPGEPVWKTALGAGRPGWHIEDTAISGKYLGEQYDIHGGAVDLKFPHHEAEIAQAEAASGKKPFVKIWMHAGHLLIDEKKMSKSLGNFVTLEDLLNVHSGNAFRFMILSHHYRSPMNYTDETMRSAEAGLQSIGTFIAQLDFIADRTKNKARSPDVKDTAARLKERTESALEDDFNTPEMIGTIFGLTNSLKDSVWDLGADDAKTLKNAILAPFASVGLEFAGVKIPLKIKRMARKRELFRRNKQFVQSDDLRNKIKDVGYSIDDTPLGPFVYKNF